MTTIVSFINPDRFSEIVGRIPEFLSAEDPRGVVDQINERYAHGGGWVDLPIGKDGWDMTPNGKLTYPDDADMAPVGFTKIHEELVFFYEHGMVVILVETGDFRVARLD